MSNNDGCIIARSHEANTLGVAMGDPSHLHREILTRPGVEVFSSHEALYGDMSRRVMETLSVLAPEREISSLDEAFLHLAGLEWRGLMAYARQRQATVRRPTGIPVSIGIGLTKTLAKSAHHLAKTAPDTGGVGDLTTAMRAVRWVGRRRAKNSKSPVHRASPAPWPHRCRTRHP